MLLFSDFEAFWGAFRNSHRSRRTRRTLFKLKKYSQNSSQKLSEKYLNSFLLAGLLLVLGCHGSLLGGECGGVDGLDLHIGLNLVAHAFDHDALPGLEA